MSHWEGPGLSDEWYTPRTVFDALGCSFDLDLAAPAGGPPTVPAAFYFDKSLDGLTRAWWGFIWMNPPFGGRNALVPWLERFFEHKNGVALVPDRTSAPWFQAYAPLADSILFTRKLRFLRPDGSEGKSPSTGSALLAAGSSGIAALEQAASLGFGTLWRPAGAAA